MTKILREESPEIEHLEKLFTSCFNKLTGNDGENFDDTNNQDFGDWFGIEYLKDYLKYSYVILAKDNEKLIGGAIIGMQNPLSYPDGNKFELFILGVLPEYRERGIGKLLVDKTLHLSKEKGAHSVILNTHELMTNTQRFYENLGFEKIGTLKKYYGNGSAVFFLKSLIH